MFRALGQMHTALRITLLSLLLATLAHAEIELTTLGYSTTRPDIANISFNVLERRTSIAAARELLDQRQSALNEKIKKVTSEYSLLLTRESVEDADRYTSRVNNEVTYVVTREMTLSLKNEPAEVKALLTAIFEGCAAATPRDTAPTVSFGLRDCTDQLAKAFDDAQSVARGRAAILANHSKLKLGRLLSVKESVAPVSDREVAIATSPSHLWFIADRDDEVVVSRSWTFTFATE